MAKRHFNLQAHRRTQIGETLYSAVVKFSFARKKGLLSMGLILFTAVVSQPSHSETMTCAMVASKYELGKVSPQVIHANEFASASNRDLAEYLSVYGRLEVNDPNLRDRLYKLVGATEFILLNRNQRLKDNTGFYILRETLEDLRANLFRLMTQLVEIRDEEAINTAIQVLEKISAIAPTTFSRATLAQYARSLIGVGPLVNRSIADYMLLFRSLQIRPPVDLQYRMLNHMANRWQYGRIRRFDVMALVSIRQWGFATPMVEGRFVLQRMADIFFSSKHFEDNKSNSTAGHFIKFLVLVDPIFARKLLETKYFAELGPKLIDVNDKLAVDSIQFASAYFKFVLKKPIRWLAEIAKAEATELESSVTDHQRLLQQVLVKEFPDIQMEQQIPKTPFVVDFLSASAKLVVEVDGKFHNVLAPIGDYELRLWDIRREEILKALGYKVIRFSNQEIVNAALSSKASESP